MLCSIERSPKSDTREILSDWGFDLRRQLVDNLAARQRRARLAIQLISFRDNEIAVVLLADDEDGHAGISVEARELGILSLGKQR